MFYRFLKITILFIFTSVLVLPNFILGEENLKEICVLERIEQRCRNIGAIECRKLLEKCEKYYQKESTRIEADINKTEREKRTLRNKISGLNKQIENLGYQINQSNLVIKDLKIQIEDTTVSIEKTSSEIEDLEEKLSNILRTFNREDQKSIVETLFAEEKISDFFDSLMALETLNYKNKKFLQNIKTLKSSLEQQKVSLDEEKDGFEKIVRIQTLQRQEDTRARNEQRYYLSLTEREYQEYVKERAEIDKRAAEIRSRLFELIGVPEAPTFGEALDLAEWVQGKTGIRPAFLLAIITQESALGRNVGQCRLPRDPAENIRRRVMHSTRDVPHFRNITRELGRDPYDTLISCPMAVGFGGAMGPAQFIPSTWANRRHILEPLIQGTPNPWDIRHAFLASALYLRDLGGRANERQAALRYFAGGNWANPRFAFYGNQVVARVDCLQTFIDHGTMTERCGRLIFIPK